jgi:hypothetical protein
MSVWTKIGQCLEDFFSHCPFPVEQTWWCVSVVGRAERPRQPLREAGRGAISIKEILGETGDLHLIKKIQFFLKIIFII